jgi:hypothetical protein
MPAGVYTNAVGLNDASVTADYPLVGVFKKNGKKAYAAYKAGTNSLTVNFSDGNRLEASPHALTIQP